MSEPPPSKSALRRLRPWSVTLLALGVLTNAGLNTARLALAFTQWSFIYSLQGIPPLYLVFSGLVWAVTAWLLAWGLWIGAGWAARAARIFVTAFLLFFWFERLFLFEQNQLSWPENGFFLLLVTIAVLVFVFWSTANTKAKRFFGEINERTS